MMFKCIADFAHCYLRLSISACPHIPDVVHIPIASLYQVLFINNFQMYPPISIKVVLVNTHISPRHLQALLQLCGSSFIKGGGVQPMFCDPPWNNHFGGYTPNLYEYPHSIVEIPRGMFCLCLCVRLILKKTI